MDNFRDVSQSKVRKWLQAMKPSFRIVFHEEFCTMETVLSYQIMVPLKEQKCRRICMVALRSCVILLQDAPRSFTSCFIILIATKLFFFKCNVQSIVLDFNMKPVASFSNSFFRLFEEAGQKLIYFSKAPRIWVVMIDRQPGKSVFPRVGEPKK